jgi:hypothetical protein
MSGRRTVEIISERSAQALAALVRDQIELARRG